MRWTSQGLAGLPRWRERVEEGQRVIEDAGGTLTGVYVTLGRYDAVEVGDEVQELGPGGLVHVEAATPRRVSNAGDDDLVLLVVGGKDGYVGRDGQMVDPADIERRRSFGSGG